MTLIRALLVAALPALVAAGHQDPEPVRRALVIGINRYQYADAQLASWRQSLSLAGGARSAGAGSTAASERLTVRDLDGAVNDARGMAELLRARYGFRDVTLLTDSAATRDAILAALERLIASSNRGDVVTFYYAGHGSQRVNSGASNLTRLDQTLVPADANAGQFDIRNKELARIFNRLLDKGVVLTLIFDSCHSGSVTRGETAPFRVRWAAADPRDAADSTNPTPPEERGALFIAAAQDYQTAKEESDPQSGVAHGTFSGALMRVMRSVPADEPAEQVFKRVQAIVQWHGRDQDPILRGVGNDRRRPLFGLRGGALAGRTTVGLLRAEGDTAELQGGQAIGLTVGSELRLVDSVRGTPARLRVTAITGMGSSRAVRIAGDAATLRTGALFVVEKWGAGNSPSLRAWIPDALTGAARSAAIAGFRPLRAMSSLQWVDDPTTLPDDGAPLYVVRYTAAGWRVQVPSGALLPLRAAMAAEAARVIHAAEAQEAARVAAEARAMNREPAARPTPRVFLLVPPSTTMRQALRVGPRTENDAIALAPDARGADYMLAGRLGDSGVAYAWLRPNATTTSQRTSPFPARTDWIAPGGAVTDATVGDSLTQMAQRLGRIQGWLTVEAPENEGLFPYELCLRNRSTNECLTGGETVGGQVYDLVLRRDADIPEIRIERRYVYVFLIDAAGNATPFYPQDGNTENRIPFDSAGASRAPVEMRLPRRSGIRIREPYGVDTFILVTSVEQLDVEAFRFSGVRTRGAAEAPQRRGLAGLLTRVGGATRGAGDEAVPAEWSIQRVVVRSRAP